MGYVPCYDLGYSNHPIVFCFLLGHDVMVSYMNPPFSLLGSQDQNSQIARLEKTRSC
jgi:hypothetical protein